MSYQAIFFAVAVGIGLIAAIVNLVNQEPPRSYKSINDKKPPATEREPCNNSWQEGRRNTKPELNRCMDRKEVRCNICCKELHTDSFRLVTCKHEFHACCISDWLIGNKFCPLCRDGDKKAL